MSQLSVIIPAYNAEKSVEKAFESVKSQSGFKDMEVIFIDDCSSDTTYEITSEICDRYDNVKLFKTDKNSGFAGKPRNIGIENSKGKYLLFLDCDDELLTDSIKPLMDRIVSTGSDIAVGAFISRDDDKEEYNSPLYFGDDMTFKKGCDAGLLNIVPAISAKIFKRDFLIKNNIRFLEEIPGQDFVFLTESLLKSDKVTVLNNHYVYLRNINRESVSFRPDENYLTGLITAYLSVFDLFEKYCDDLNIQKIVFKRHLSFFTTQILRTFYLDGEDNTVPYKVLHSKDFETLKNKEVFINNKDYHRYFKYMDTGYYNDAKRLIRSMESDLKDELNRLYEENLRLKSNLDKKTEEIQNLRDEIEVLKNKLNNP